MRFQPVDLFWAWINERHRIHLYRKDKKDWPWTSDTIMQEYSFTNVFRELDKTTVWFRKNVRGVLRSHPDVIMATIIFRWFNRIEVGAILGDHNLFVRWNADKCYEVLKDVDTITTGAYIISSPPGLKKLDGVIECIDAAWQDRVRTKKILTRSSTLEEAWEHLRTLWFMGNFMAYEVVTDLRHTFVLENSSDIYMWANPGPGARRGLNRIHRRPLEKRIPSEQCIKEMQELWGHHRSRDEVGYGKLELREIEHSLCEIDKYMRVLHGEGRPRQKYKPPERTRL